MGCIDSGRNLIFRAFNEDISRWNVSRVTSMIYMFFGTPIFNQNLSLWDVSKVKNMFGMFSMNFEFQGTGLQNWNTINVQNMSNMFMSNEVLDINLSQWDTSNVIDMNGMFYGASSFVELVLIIGTQVVSPIWVVCLWLQPHFMGTYPNGIFLK
jgi:surface protein